MLKIATWNVNSLRVRLPHVLEWLTEHQPDVLALQELKLEDKDFPINAFTELNYHSAFVGQKTYNGVALLSRMPGENIEQVLPGAQDPQKRLLAATFNQVRVINVYVPNGEAVSSIKYTYKLNWLEYLKKYIHEQLKQYHKLILLGDFNIAPENEDVYDPRVWEGQVLFSEPERKALQELISVGLQDTFRLFEQPEKSYTWWDYRAAAFRRNMGLRIDHILASTKIAVDCKSCQIDKAPRKLERPSDHAPVVAMFG